VPVALGVVVELKMEKGAGPVLREFLLDLLRVLFCFRTGPSLTQRNTRDEQ